MKKGIVAAVFTAMLGMTVHAQTSNGQNPPPPPKDHPKMSPEEASKHQAEHAQKELGLTEDQKIKFEAFALQRMKNVKPIRDKAKATQDQEERKKLREQAKAQAKLFDDNVKSILTTEQQPKWEEHKKKAREHQKEMRGKRKANGGKGQGDNIEGIDELDLD